MNAADITTQHDNLFKVWFGVFPKSIFTGKKVKFFWSPMVGLSSIYYDMDVLGSNSELWNHPTLQQHKTYHWESRQIVFKILHQAKAAMVRHGAISCQS